MMERKEAERRLLTALDVAIELGVSRGIPLDEALAMAAAHAAGGLASLIGPDSAGQFIRQLASETERLPGTSDEADELAAPVMRRGT